MKVLHLSAGNLYGGVETFLSTLARYRHLCPAMEPHFGLCFRGRQWDELAAAGVPVHDLGAVRLSRPWTVWQARRRLGRVLRAERFDAVIAHSSWPHVVFAPAVRRAGSRLVHWVHGAPQGGGLDRLGRLAARTPPRLVIANSRFTADAIAGLFPGVRTEVVHCPVPPPPLPLPGVRDEVRGELYTPAGNVAILMAARLDWMKGHQVLIAALARLKETASWTCWIAGGPQLPRETASFAELQRLATTADIGERVRFLGQRADVTRLMQAADIYCQPNIGPESFGLVFVEALYAGLPVVTSAIGGAVEIVNETCGLLTPPGDVLSLMTALDSLVGDPVSRAVMSERGPSRAVSLTDPERQLGRLAAILEGV